MSQPVVQSVCVFQRVSETHEPASCTECPCVSGSVWERPMSQPVVLSVCVFQGVSERDP